MTRKRKYARLFENADVYLRRLGSFCDHHKITSKLKMKPFRTTLMGVLKGVANYFGIVVSDVLLFRGSGHSFVIVEYFLKNFASCFR